MNSKHSGARWLVHMTGRLVSTPTHTGIGVDPQPLATRLGHVQSGRAHLPAQQRCRIPEGAREVSLVRLRMAPRNNCTIRDFTKQVLAVKANVDVAHFVHLRILDVEMVVLSPDPRVDHHLQSQGLIASFGNCNPLMIARQSITSLMNTQLRSPLQRHLRAAGDSVHKFCHLQIQHCGTSHVQFLLRTQQCLCQMDINGCQWSSHQSWHNR